jgi:hypothetical protein
MRRSKVFVGVIIIDDVGLTRAYLGRKIFPKPEQHMGSGSPVKEMS